MITLLSITIAIILTTCLLNHNYLWANSIFYISVLLITSIIILPPINSLNNLSWGLNNDSLSTPLIYLSLWLAPISLAASMGHLLNSSTNNNKTFITLILIIIFFLMITFSANNLIILFLGFEGTLLPTLFLISRWGTNKERIEAGFFFVFYTLASSLPLFIGLLYLNNNNVILSIIYLSVNPTNSTNLVITTCCITAFLVKVPIFSLHLWLPKAHVEAPVSGSMILAAVLLKMGGYGFIRLITLFSTPFHLTISNILIPFCIWGGVLTSLICITQTDLKSLIAYSSVSHMSFMIAGISTFYNWAITGGLIIMIAHGIVSSALFCIANTFYERSSTRNLFINRGTKIMFSITPSLWLIFTSANMGIPPFPNALGEITVITSIIANNLLNFAPLALGIIATGIFSLLMFLAINSSNLNTWSNINSIMNEREHNTLALHLIPLILIILSPNIITPWSS